MAVNSAGTLVGAVLESAGYIYQANLLDSLTAPLKDEIGALIYLVGVAIVIFQYTVLKSAKMAPWLLIGPPLFFAIILDRSSIDQAKWSFGSSDRDPGGVQVTKSNKSVSEGKSGAANVSTVFRRFVNMTSDVNRSIVDTINGVQLKNDLWFIAKGEFFASMRHFKEEDPGLLSLMHYGLSGHCFDVIQAAKAVNNPLYRLNADGADLPGGVKAAVDEARRYWVQSQAEAQKTYEELLVLPKHSFQNNPKVTEYILKLQTISAGNLIAGTIGGIFTSPLFGVVNQILYSKDIQPQTLYSCKDIWGFTLMGILEKSNVIEKDLEKKAEEMGIEKEAILNLLGQSSGVVGGKLLSANATSPIAAEDIARIIAKFYLRNEMQSSDPGSRIAHFVGNHDLRRIETRLEGDFSGSERDRIGVQEWSEKERLAHAAYSMPVYQGLMLYFLGLTFPFFALLLLIPGKASGFLMWFMLWIWAKSWDIGMAIVMQLDTIFWSLFAVQKQRMGNNDFIPDDLSTAMVALEQMDPTFQMGTYYTLLAVCVLAIPPVTGNLILGSMRAGSNIIAAGINQFSEFFATNMGGRVEQGAITQLKSDSISLRDLRGIAYALGGDGKSQLLEGREDRGLSPQGSVAGKRMENGVSSFQTDLSRAVDFTSATSPRHMDRREMQAAVDKATLINRAEGIVAPLKVLGGGYSNVSSALFKLQNLQDLTIEKAANEGQFKKLVAQATSETAQADFEGGVDAMAYELNRRMAIFRAIPVPWVTESDDGSAKEIDRHLADFDMRMNILKSYTDFVAEGGKAIGEVAASIPGAEKQKAMQESPELKNLVPGLIGSGVSTSFFQSFFQPLFGGGESLDENAKIREAQFEATRPEMLRQDLENSLNAKERIINYRENPVPGRYRNMEFGGELVEGQGEGAMRRSLREQSNYGAKKTRF